MQVRRRAQRGAWVGGLSDVRGSKGWGRIGRCGRRSGAGRLGCGRCGSAPSGAVPGSEGEVRVPTVSARSRATADIWGANRFFCLSPPPRRGTRPSGPARPFAAASAKTRTDALPPLHPPSSPRPRHPVVRLRTPRLLELGTARRRCWPAIPNVRRRFEVLFFISRRVLTIRLMRWRSAAAAAGVHTPPPSSLPAHARHRRAHIEPWRENPKRSRPRHARRSLDRGGLRNGPPDRRRPSPTHPSSTRAPSAASGDQRTAG